MTDWININDKLPPQAVWVLVCQFDFRPKVKMSFVCIAERVGDLWYDGYDGDELTQNGKYGVVTHWMPIPTPPRDKDE